MMSHEHRPLLPQLLILFREDEERVDVEPVEPQLESDSKARHRHGLHRGAQVRKAG